MLSAKKIHLLTSGGVLAFWVLDAAIDARFFDPRSFLDSLLRPSGYEIYVRSLVGCVLLVSGLVWSLNVRQNHRVREIHNEKPQPLASCHH